MLFCNIFKIQGVALTGRNTTGPPCSVGRPTVHAPGGRPPGSVTDDDDSHQNNSGPLGGPVIKRLKMSQSDTNNNIETSLLHLIFSRYSSVLRFSPAVNFHSG